MKTRTIRIKAATELGRYCDTLTRDTRILRNTANFIIRNKMTGLKKSPEKRTHNETEVLHIVFTGIRKANLAAGERFRKAVRTIGRSGDSPMAKHAKVHEKLNKTLSFSYPTADHWMLSYGQLDAILKALDHAAYYALPSQVNQQALKKTVQSWTSYFRALRAYEREPSSFKKRPNIPGYIRTEGSAAHITNQRIKETGTGTKRRFSLPGTTLELQAGGGFDGPLIKVEILPSAGGFLACITYEDGSREASVPKDPSRILGLDPGVGNFLTGTWNFAESPFIISGGWIKSENRWFNKRRAKLLSDLTRGTDSTHSVKNSRRLDAMTRRRKDRMDDFFYKTAHWIMRACREYGVQVIVLGHNNGQKQGADMGHANNQNFVSIPYTRFQQILKTVGSGYQIPVVIREESYTSKASLMDLDPIPAYGKETGDTPVFSGKRIRRGCYLSGNGTLLNADVNSAGNIIRKEYPDAFQNITDWTFLTETVRVVTRNMLCRAKVKEKTRYRKRASLPRRLYRREYSRAKHEYRTVFRNVDPSKGVVGV